MRTRINASSLRWNFYNKPDEPRPVLVVWSHTAIPSKLKSIKCGNVNCTDSFELINKPWWDLPEDIITPKYVRSNGTIAGYKSISAPYYYIYRWKEAGAVPIDTISLVSENAITGESQVSVKAIYPVVNVASQLLEEPKNHYLFNIDILGPIDSEYAITEQTKDNWRVNILSSTCKVVKKEGNRFVFDCSNVAMAQWPYPFDYTISLYYKNAKIRDEYGEMFVNVEVPQTYTYLNMDNISDFQEDGYDLSPYLTSGVGKSIYVIPEGSSFEVNGDLELGDSTLIIENGATLEIWPMIKITTENIVILGDLENSPTILSSKEGLPGWSGIEISGEAYIRGTEIKDTVNIENGAIYGDDISSLQIINSSFTNNKANINCSNCNIEIENVNVVGGISGLKSSNSHVTVDGFSCAGTTFCFEVEDNIQQVTNLSLEDLKAWGFNVIGASTDLTINDITSAIKVPAILAYRDYPKITKNFSEEGFEIVGITEIRYDNPSMYEGLKNTNLEELKRKYVNVIEQDKNDSQKFHMKKSEVQLDRDLVMPEGTELVIDAGTKINLAKNVSILSYGKLNVLGEPGKEVIFRSSSKKDKSWGVIIVKDAEAEAYIQNAIFENGGDDYLVSFEYTGAVTADHAKSLIVKDSEFKGNTGDDALNCKYTNCFIENNIFINNAMDGIDFDFAVEGSKITGNKFEGNGNDAIDVSSDKSLIYNNEIVKSGDKCISVGEGSNSYIFENIFDSCNIGVETKDGSEVTIFNNIFKNNKIAVNAYQKKRRFLGGGVANVYNCDFENNAEQTLQDKYSKINIIDNLPTNIFEKFKEYLK